MTAPTFTTSTVYSETVVQYAEPVALVLLDRVVYVDQFATASEYGTPDRPVYWFTGRYARKDGTQGKAPAHNLVGPYWLPTDVYAALTA